MTFEFDHFDTEIQCDEFTDERVSDEQLAEADEFYDDLEIHLDAMDEALDYHELNAELDEQDAVADEDWNEHREDFDEELHGWA